MKLVKFLSLATVSFSLLTTLPLTPVSANPSTQIHPGRYGENLIAQAMTRLGRIIETSGSSVVVAFRDGSTREYQVSREDMERMGLTQDSYVTVDGERIIGAARIGRVVAIVGDVLTYKLLNGTIGTVALSEQSFVSTLDLKGGKYIYLTNNQILAIANTEQTEIINRRVQTRTVTLTEETQPVRRTVVREVEPAPVQQVVEPVKEPVMTEPVVTKPAPIKKPIRGMW